ncbi:MAG: 50S ribosomal protein L6 [Nanoarchaeota archaeon]
MRPDIHYEIDLPAGVSAEVNGRLVAVKGPRGTVEKLLPSKKISITANDKIIIVGALKPTQREKKLANTFRAHILHMVVGALEGHMYKLKVCSGHFPMTATVKGDTLEVKNFLGESKPRLLKLKQGAEVKVNGEEIVVESPNKEIAGQVAADIEQLTRITNRDRRIFQDGIYITEKSKTRPIPEAAE